VTISLKNIQSAVYEARNKWRYHALRRFRERGITREQVKRVMQEGQILEQYPMAKPFPKCLMMAMVELDRPLYVALAYDEDTDYIYVITVYWLDASRWEDPWTRRAKTLKM